MYFPPALEASFLNGHQNETHNAEDDRSDH
jgi:hypothetical protein